MYQPLLWLKASGSVASCFHCLVYVYLMSCHYCCCYRFTNTGAVVMIIIKLLTKQTKPKYYDGDSVKPELLRFVVTVLFIFHWCTVASNIVILSRILVSWYHSSVNYHPHRSNQNIESSSVSLCKLVLHLNCFSQSLPWSYISICAGPTVTSVNRQQTKHQVNNTKGKKCFTQWMAWKVPFLVLS